MSLIEGVGDEVTIGVSVFVLLCLILLAWFSTHTRDIPFVSIIVVELSQRRNRNRNNGENTLGSDEGEATQQEVNGSGDNVSAGSRDGEESVGSNNNAQTPADNEGESEPSATSKSVVPDFSEKSSFDVGSDKDTKSSPNTQTQGGVSVETAEENIGSEISADLHDSPGQVKPAEVHAGSLQPSLAAAAENVLAPVVEEGAAVTIPEFTVERQSSDELRRRRVAYFESGKDSKASEALGSDGRSLACAESEQSSLGAQGQAGSDVGSLTQTLSSIACGVGGSQVTAVTDSVSLHDSSPTRLEPSAHTPSSQPPTEFGTPTVVTDTASSLDGPPSSTVRRETQADAGLSSDAGVSFVTDETTARTDSSPGGEQQIRVRLKYLNDTQRLVYAHPQETVGNFRRLHFSSELEENKIVRFIFNGQDLRNDLSTLRAYNISDNSVIHCLITQNRQAEQPAGPRQRGEEEDRQMGELIYPVFGLILGLVWYLRFSYKQYFNAMSTVSLAGVSFVYLLALFSSLRHRRQPHQHLD